MAGAGQLSRSTLELQAPSPLAALSPAPLPPALHAFACAHLCAGPREPPPAHEDRTGLTLTLHLSWTLPLPWPSPWPLPLLGPLRISLQDASAALPAEHALHAQPLPARPEPRALRQSWLANGWTKLFPRSHRLPLQTRVQPTLAPIYQET